MKLEQLQLEAQSVLDDLWAEKQIPFPLTAHRVESIGLEEYIIRFGDSRLSALDFSWKNYHSFEDAVRVAVLARVARLSGTLRANANKGLRLDPNSTIDTDSASL